MLRHFKSSSAFALSAMLIVGSSAPVSLAQSQPATPYDDVPAGAWYEESAAALIEIGALDPSERLLRPQALATRAELAKLLVRVSGNDLMYPATSSFDDVPKNAWYFPYIEASAKAGWMKGDRNCYETGEHPCTARPGDGVNRAEAAALLVRAFVLEYLNIAPVFPDNDQSSWYFVSVQAAADYCILQGDDVNGRVRPAALMNRAEMIAMFHRASQELMYGEDCGEKIPAVQIETVTAMSVNHVRITFSEAVRTSLADNASQYSIAASGGRRGVEVESVSIVSSRTMELRLADDLEEGITYTVTARDLQSEDGNTFTDSATFQLGDTQGRISSVEAVANNRVRVTFSENVRSTIADNLEQYTIVTASNNRLVDIDTVTIVNSQTVELRLDDTLDEDTTYSITARNIQSSDGDAFTDTATFRFGTVGTGQISLVEAVSDLRVRVTFSEDVENNIADNPARYAITASGGRHADVDSVTIINNRLVELQLGDSLDENVTYTLVATNIETMGGRIFTDSETFRLEDDVTGQISSVDVLTDTRLRVTFDVDLNETRAEEEQRYMVTGPNGTLDISTAIQRDARTVELTLQEEMEAQEIYTVEAIGMQTEGGVVFSSERDVVFTVEGNVSFDTELRGSSEVPPNASLASGSGTFTLSSNGLQYDITLYTLTGGGLTGAHFHRGAVGVSGPVLEPITFVGNRATGTWTDLTAEERHDLISGRIYVNVHTAQYPDGEIRGQIIKH